MTARLEQQISFLNEADKLKSTIRATGLCDNSRYENSAEHSWHLTLYALVLADQAGPDVDLNLVIRMLILHDLVEIDAGDNPIFGDHDIADMEAQEQAAADRIFGLLPADLRVELLDRVEQSERDDRANLGLDPTRSARCRHDSLVQLGPGLVAAVARPGQPCVHPLR